MWFGALLGPIAIPMLLGLLPAFKKCNSASAILSIAGGFAAFIITKTIDMNSMALEVSLPLITSVIIYVITGLANAGKRPAKRVEDFMNLLFDKQK